MDDALRRRLDTGCTVESKDSGIEVRRMRPPRRYQKINENVGNVQEEEGLWDIASILWIFVFTLTVWIFHLPMSIWFSKKVNWSIMYLSILFYAISLSNGLYMYIKYRGLSPSWNKGSPILYKLSLSFFMLASFCDISAFWLVFGWNLLCYFDVSVIVIRTPCIVISQMSPSFLILRNW